MRNITLSADDVLIDRARLKAAAEHVTLNEKFRAWLLGYVGQDQRAQSFRELMDKLGHARPGRQFSRDEANSRR